MTRFLLRLLVAALALAAASLAVVHPALAAESAGLAQASLSSSWGAPEPLPGTAALNSGGQAGVGALSCPSRGNCSALGVYTDSQQVEHAFTASEANGSWQRAVPAPGIPGIGAGGITIASLSCVSAGNCVAGGSFAGNYSTNYDTGDAFLMSESGGTWSSAVNLSSLGLSSGSGAQVTSVTCPAAGDCVAAGTAYADSGGYASPFVVDETSGTWGNVQQVAGEPDFGPPQVACVSAGNCFLAVGNTVAAEVGGTWGAAEALPANLTTAALSCVPGGDCTVGGYEPTSATSFGSYEAAVDTETDGTWGAPVLLAHALNVGENAQVTALSCMPGENCDAVGYYSDASGQSEPFAASELGGTWQPVEELQQPVSSGIRMTAISCPSAGNCGALGSDGGTGIVVNEVDGTWGGGQATPGSLAGFQRQPTLISCPAASACIMGGQEGDEAYVASQEAPTTTTLALSAASVPYGDEQAERLSVTVASQVGTPGGVVTIAAGSATACAGPVTGSGYCTLRATEFNAGSYRLTASYHGSPQFQPSTATAKTLTVSKAHTVTGIALSAGTLKFGHENSLRIAVTVSPPYGGTPTGTVTVKAGSTTVCAITLKAGKGTCAPTAKRLNLGSHLLTATYAGNVDFLPSASARKTLRVVR